MGESEMIFLNLLQQEKILLKYKYQGARLQGIKALYQDYQIAFRKTVKHLKTRMNEVDPGFSEANLKIVSSGENAFQAFYKQKEIAIIKVHFKVENGFSFTTEYKYSPPLRTEKLITS